MAEGVTLLTGAGGFIGAHLVRRLLDEGGDVHAIVRPSTELGRLSPFAERLTIHRIDLSDRLEIRRCIRGIAPRRVFHLAAETRLPPQPDFAAARASHAIYLQPALNLLQPLAELPRPPEVVVRAGTIAEYGRAALPYREDARAVPSTPYGAGMLATTEAIAMLAPRLPFPVVTARLALCYGPGQAPSFLIPALIDACLSRQPMTIRRPADRRDLIHVDDAIDALLQIARQATRQDVPDCVNICSGDAPTMEEVACRIEAMTGCPENFLPRAEPEDAPVELCSSPDLAAGVLGWRRRIELDEGLARTIAGEQLMCTKAG
nr:NAD(P)-dependent oxidoreductase [uncultured Novosphingobium sp.]